MYIIGTYYVPKTGMAFNYIIIIRHHEIEWSKTFSLSDEKIACSIPTVSAACLSYDCPKTLG